MKTIYSFIETFFKSSASSVLGGGQDGHDLCPHREQGDAVNK